MKRSGLMLGLVAVLFATGCEEENCYWAAPGEGDRDPSGLQYDPGLRNPQTGQCEFYGGGGGGGGGGYYCEGDQGDPRPRPAPTPTPELDPAAPLPAWGECYSACDGLDESTCQAAADCQAAYVTPHDLPDEVFIGCWQTSPSIASDVHCQEVANAFECSTRDDCKKVHYQFLDEDFNSQPLPDYGEYAYCIPEQAGCYSDEECGTGFDCTADTECLSPPGCGAGQDCPAVCYGRCVPDGSNEAGACYTEPLCDSLPPECPEGTLPGVKDGCWTGYCIPQENCEAAPECSSLTSEDQCIAADCSPFYQGENCECEGDDCTCEDWLFASCGQ